ncbi:MAG: hypothetical protein CMM93_08000, partial [Rickettsiales bacterium]|nr:hypothetical protein [Rickettsiales bacterium]
MEIDPSEKHPQYDAMVDTWQMCRDCVTGQRAVHAARDTYLPMLSGQERKQYDAYLKRALYMNATGRTVEGMVGMVFRKYPTIALPDALKEIELDIDMSGVSLAGKAQDIVTEVIKVGRAGILVDMPQAGETEEGVAPTISQTREQGIRPYLAMYKAEDILNWTYERVNNQTQLTQVFLAEIDETGAHDFQVRELFLEGGVYGQRIWRKQQSGWKNGGDIFPLIGGKAITRIPFWFCQP